MDALFVTLAVVFLLLSLLAHEVAHALAMRHNGIQIEEMGLGLPIGPVLSFKPKRLPFRLTLSLALVGAYVKAREEDREKLENLPYVEHAWTSGAGVIANLMVWAGLLSVIAVIQGMAPLALAWVGVVAVIWFARRILAAFILPAVSLPIFFWFAYVVLDSLGEPAGVVAMADVMGSVSGGMEVLKLTAVINLSLALLNILPIFPMDGGRIVNEIVARWLNAKAVRLFQATGLGLAVGLTVYVLLSDLFYL